MEQILDSLKPVLEALAGGHGWLVTALVVIGGLRLVMKPFMTFIQAVVDLTPTPKDNELLKKVLESKVYKAISFALDWFGSVKLPQLPQLPKV